MDALKHCNLILRSSLAPQILVINASLLYVGILPSHVLHQKAEKQRGVREAIPSLCIAHVIVRGIAVS